MVVRWLDVRVVPTELTSDEETERNLDDWRRINVMHECDGLNLYSRKYQIKKYKRNVSGYLNLCLVFSVIGYPTYNFL
jgi:hypothetical protein